MITPTSARRLSTVLLALTAVLPITACEFSVGTTGETTAHPSASPAAQAGPHRTIADYLRDEGITETAVLHGDATAPEIVLPALPGWVDATEQAGQSAYRAVKYDGAEIGPDDYTPNVIVFLSRLTGPTVDANRILDLAPAEVRNLPGYAQYGSPGIETLAGYRAHKIAATYDLDGMAAIVGQSTVVIAGAQASYVAQISVTGARTQEAVVKAAVQAIDQGLLIRP